VLAFHLGSMLGIPVVLRDVKLSHNFMENQKQYQMPLASLYEAQCSRATVNCRGTCELSRIQRSR
jgi:hypothetical protein